MNLFGKKEKQILGVLGISASNVTIPEDDFNLLMDYKFPSTVISRTKEELNASDAKMKVLVYSLLEFLYFSKDVSHEMTSEAVDALWHNFILDTKSYMDFSLNYLGAFIHHKPYEKKHYVSKHHVASYKIKIEQLRFLNPKWKRNTDRAYNDYRHDEDYDNDTAMLTMFAVAMLSEDTSETNSDTGSSILDVTPQDIGRLINEQTDSLGFESDEESSYNAQDRTSEYTSTYDSIDYSNPSTESSTTSDSSYESSKSSYSSCGSACSSSSSCSSCSTCSSD